MERMNIGVVGLAVMGQNLVLNMANRGYSVRVYNRTEERTRRFIEEREERTFMARSVWGAHSTRRGLAVKPFLAKIPL